MGQTCGWEVGLQDCPGHQVRSGSCSQEPSHSLSVQRFWKGAGNLPDVPNYELLYEHFKKNLPPHQYDMVMEQFLTGRLDAKILPAVLAKRKDFRPAEFSFLLLENQDSMESLDFLSLGSSDQQEKLRKLRKQLCVEQAAWRTHLAKLKAHEDAALGDFNQQVMRQQDALDEAWKDAVLEHCWSVRPEQLLQSTSVEASRAHNAPSLEFLAFLSFMNGISPKRGSASRIFNQVVPIIAQTCSSDPKMVIHIVVPPCQPMFGKGEAAGDERAESVAQNVDRLWGELANPSNGLCVRKVVGVWDSETFYSHDRDLGFEYWLVVSDSCRARAKTGVFNHIFGNSVLMKRGAFPTMMKAMERKDFANWKQPLGFGDQKHPTSGHESYQWFSGAQLFGAVLGELIKGSILTQNHVLVVVDGCLYDAETAKACLEQNCKQGNSQPRAIFLGLSWIQEKDLIRQGVLLIEHAAT